MRSDEKWIKEGMKNVFVYNSSQTNDIFCTDVI